MRSQMSHLAVAATTVCVLVLLAGCGGTTGSVGGGPGSVSPPPAPGSTSNPPGATREAAAAATLGVYVSGGATGDDKYAQVWITLFKIEGSRDDGKTFEPFFSDVNGATLNLVSLKNAAQLLAITATSSAATVAAPKFSSLRVTLGDQVTLVPTENGDSKMLPLAGDKGAPAAEGKVTLSLAAVAPVSDGPHRGLVVDFDPAAFTVVDEKIRLNLKATTDAERFKTLNKRAHALRGTVANLSAAAFDLVTGDQAVVAVTLADGASALGEAASSTLQNGQSVEVKGTVAADPARFVIAADRVHAADIKGGSNGAPEARAAEGTITTVDSAGGAFVLALRQAERFQPSGPALTVRTNAKTVFHQRRSPREVDETTGAVLAPGAAIEALGAYDAATQTLTAARVEIR